MKLDDLRKELKVSDEVAQLTRKPRKPKQWSKVVDNIPLKADLNFMADLLFLPEDKKGFKYLLVVVDLATNEFDIEPMKDKESESVKKAFEAIIKRKYVKMPQASVATDDGTEFQGSFHKWLKDHNIYHKISLAGRHQQTSTVENLNRQLGYLFNVYMNQKEKDTGETYKNWTDIIKIVRERLNEIRRRPEQSLLKVYNMPDIGNLKPKFKVGDVVYFKSEVPLDALGNKQPTTNSRVGDFHFNVSKRKIVKILVFNGKVPFRYLLEGIPRASFTDNELILVPDATESTYILEDILDKRKYRNKVQYKVKWKGYPRSQATWEDIQRLKDDGLNDYIERYEDEHKK